MTIDTPQNSTKNSYLNPVSNSKTTGIRILATGLCAPEKEVKNEDLAKLGYDSDWIVQRTGIQSRRHISATEATSDLAYKAAKQCLENAGVEPTEVDFIVVSTMTADYPCPTASCQIQDRLGCQHIGAVDVNAACSGFMYGLVIASQFVANGIFRRVLVIGAESMSTLVDPKDIKTYPLFGDGAAAILLGPTDESDPVFSDADGNHLESGILAFRLAADGSLGDKLLIPGGGSRNPTSQKVIDERMQFLQMEGKVVFKWAVRLIPEIVNEMLEASGLVQDDIDLFIFHQANKRILDAAVDSLGVDQSKVFVNLDRYGNTSAASIPISLHEAMEQGLIESGSNVLLAGFGAGLTWGACIFRF